MTPTEKEALKTCPKCGEEVVYAEDNRSYYCQDLRNCNWSKCAVCGKSMPKCIDKWLKRGEYAEF